MKIACVTHLVWTAYRHLENSEKPDADDDPGYVEAVKVIENATGHFAELLRTAVFGKDCVDRSVWPVTFADIHSNYIRFYRSVSYYRLTENMLPSLVWVSETCNSVADCVGGNVDGRECRNGRCVEPESVEALAHFVPLPGKGAPEREVYQALLLRAESENVRSEEASAVVRLFCPQPGGYTIEEKERRSSSGDTLLPRTSCWYLGLHLRFWNKDPRGDSRILLKFVSKKKSVGGWGVGDVGRRVTFIWSLWRMCGDISLQEVCHFHFRRIGT